MINGVHHVAMATGNIDRIVAFYTEHLGFDLIMDTEWADRPAIDEIVGLKNSAAKQAMLKAGNVFVEVFEYLSPVGKPGDPNRPAADHGYTHFCLDVTDIDAEYERLLGAGMTFHCPPAPLSKLGSGKIRAIYGRDPDGNLIELQEIMDPEFLFSLQQLADTPTNQPESESIAP